MTDLYNGKLTDLIGNTSKYDPGIQAIAYAIALEKRRIIDRAKTTRTITMIDRLPEAVLDVLAVELRTPYYTGDMSAEHKRDIIKNTLVWYYRAGTPAAVEELIISVFGRGKVVEWFDYTEAPYTPGTFDIIADTRTTPDILDRFTRIIDRVKNIRSHIRNIIVRHDEESSAQLTTHVGSAVVVENVHRYILNDSIGG